MTRWTLMVLLSMGSSFQGNAQESGLRVWASSWSDSLAEGAVIRYRWMPTSPPLVLNAPFSGVESTESAAISKDGSRTKEPVVAPADITLFRDSRGRTRTERGVFSEFQGTPEALANPKVVEITDAATGVLLVLDPVRKVAHRVRFPAVTKPSPPEVHKVPATTSPKDPTQPQSRFEDAGRRLINGVEVAGIRQVIEYPPAWGGDSVVIEDWWSPELQLFLERSTVNPRSSEMFRRVMRLSIAEPDPKLFEVPEGFVMVDSVPQFRLQFSRPQ